MKHLYIIFASSLFACNTGGTVVESFNDAGERIVVAENKKAELALIEIGKTCKDQGYTIVTRGGSIIMEEGTRIVARCGNNNKLREENKETKKSFFNLNIL